MATKTKKLALMFVFLALAITSRVQAQCPAPLVTSDSLLNGGIATSVNYTAPGTGSGIAIVSAAANPGELWELFPNPWNVLTGIGSIDMTYSGTGSITTSVNLTGLNIVCRLLLEKKIYTTVSPAIAAKSRWKSAATQVRCDRGAASCFVSGSLPTSRRRPRQRRYRRS